MSTQLRKCKVKILNGNTQSFTLEYGYFHTWGCSYEEFGEFGPGNFSTAIVELLSGEVVEVLPERVTFVKESHNEDRNDSNTDKDL